MLLVIRVGTSRLLGKAQPTHDYMMLIIDRLCDTSSGLQFVYTV